MGVKAEREVIPKGGAEFLKLSDQAHRDVENRIGRWALHLSLRSATSERSRYAMPGKVTIAAAVCATVQGRNHHDP